MYFGKETKSQKRARWLDEHEGSAGAPHSGAYHRYFEGFSEERVIGKNGKSHIVREYTAKYYKRECSDKAWIITKILYCVFFVAAVFLYILGLSQRGDYNSVWYTALPGLLCAIPLLLLLFKLGNCVISPRLLKVYDKKSIFGMISVYAFIVAGLLALTLIMTFIYFAITGTAISSNAVITIICTAISALFVAAIGVMEHKAVYTTVDNPNEPSLNSVTFED